MPEEISIEYAEKMNECIDVLLGAQDTVVDATQAVSEARREIDEAKKQMLEAPQIAAEAMAQAEAANSAAIDANAAAHAASETANSAKSQAEANAAEIASVKSQTETVVNEMGQAIGAMATSLTETAEKAEANEAAIAAVQATADAAATQTALAEVKETADAALPKSGGEMTGALKVKAAVSGSSLLVTGHTNGYSCLDFHSIATQDDPDNGIVTGDEISTPLRRIYTYNNSAPLIWGTVDSNLYNATISTMKAMKDYAAMKLASQTNMYVNAETGSDTADLFMGRGFSEEKPFKSLAALFQYLNNISTPSLIEVHLKSDISISNANGVIYSNVNIGGVALNGEGHVINLSDVQYVHSGCLRLLNCNFNATATIGAFWAVVSTYSSNSSLIFQEGNTFNGTVSTAAIVARDSGQVQILGSAQITGNVTGKKYSCTNGGIIIGASKIPGTEAGTCDANSKAFG